ncbi:uncharacterized protein E0L32_002686 [Thyridium curvatum]|uniref:alpha-1,2-Mannosidase n=1 Tax=Thyridium curvatum TaxID=1093900 RepID=A0A507BE00_9PEZI|nr:uncharacterized protein E0L32_002686 [Thyridium curvatum]TPX18177.1 hypothetical protein E0L32_002686 [Thyridium curvatum]
MFRFRRYRVFVICAAILLLLLLRMSQNAQWEDSAASIYKQYTHSGPKSRPENGVTRPENARPVEVEKQPPPVQDVPVKESEAFKPIEPVDLPELKSSKETNGRFGLPTPEQTAGVEVPLPTEPLVGDATLVPADASKPTVAPDIPDRPLPKIDELFPEKQEKPLHVQNPPGAYIQDSLSATSTIHWRKPREHFPVPEESIITLPTGSPKPIPRVQHQFTAESDDAREQREWRLSKIKQEAKVAWAAYREHAWLHDELMPVSGKFKDPFCGWAATLVDSLDTLWIMGLQEEFDEAYLALDQIDFTTSPFRSEIPVFETTIRYLGGLLGAYDVTGGINGKYPRLLAKAVELAEILMGVFDTPNRMPILYYNWKPTFTSQPHRASTMAGVAELGTLLMEFTRLAQLTGRNKYYDAVARITDALEEYQNRGLGIPGIFPQNLDISGCNRTATSLRDIDNSSQGAQYQFDFLDDKGGEGYKPYGSKDKKVSNAAPDLELDIRPGSQPGEPGTAAIRKIEPEKQIEKRGANVTLNDLELEDKPAAATPTAAAASMKQREGVETKPATVPSVQNTRAPPLAADGRSAEWDCVPQNITSGGYGSDSYSMGGSQDSAYEYFPKEYLLLGGLEEKYRTMHEKTVAGVKKYLLFRPMIRDTKRNLLFSAKVTSNGGTKPNDLTYDYEVTHLTCFLGGMFGLGGRIFNSPEDIEIGKRLTDGCVWAYEVMPTGVMPEYASILPCESTTGECEFNQTMWHEKLDPGSEWRDRQLDQYLVQVEEWQAKKDELLKIQQRKKLAENEAMWTMPKKTPPTPEPVERQGEETLYDSGSAGNSTNPQPEKEDASGGQSAASAPGVDSSASSSSPSSSTSKHEKRAAVPPSAEERKKIKENLEMLKEKEKKLEAELDLNNAVGTEHYSGHRGYMAGDTAGGAQDQTVMTDEALEALLPPEPMKPLTHAEYVSNRIKNERIPPGFTSLRDRRYILRPEAIESVWYMYRITGDAAWQDKGWDMWRAIMAACKTGTAHSAIDDVADLGGADGRPQATDSMESFWIAETLKYFYLLYSEPDVMSLDEWVFNTEAHPFKRPV